MKSFSIMLAGLSLFAVSCERHEFEGPDGTKQIHEHHAAPHDEHAEAGAAHGAHEEHAEKKAAH
jgi:hypothetical protein